MLYYKVLANTGGPKSLAAVRTAFDSGNEQTKQAALDALSAWNDASSADELIKIARVTTNKNYLNQALTGYLRLIRTASNTPEQNYSCTETLWI